ACQGVRELLAEEPAAADDGDFHASPLMIVPPPEGPAGFHPAFAATVPALMIVALHHLGGPAVARREVEAGAAGEVADRAALKLLPGGVMLERGRRPGLAAGLPFGGRD